MYDRQHRRHEMLRRVVNFTEQHGNLFPEGSFDRSLAQTIRSAFEELNRHRMNQSTGIGDARVETRAKDEACQTVRRTLLAISRTAKLVSRTVPEFDTPFEMPHGRSHSLSLQTAREFVKNASAVSAVFIRYGMPLGFVENLKGEIVKAETALASRSAARSTHKSATIAIDAALKQAMNALADLDIVMSNRLAADPPIMAAWHSMRHVERKRKKKADKRKAATG